MDEVLTVKNVAQYLKIHPVTIQRWCREGRMPAAKIGRSYRVRKTELESWWRNHQGYNEHGAKFVAIDGQEPGEITDAQRR